MTTAWQKSILLGVVLGTWQARTPDVSQVDTPAAKLKLFREGKLVLRKPVTERVSIPADSAGLEVQLDVQPPNVDASLYVFGSDPNVTTWTPPLCASESLTSPKTCLVKRPDSGEAWIFIQYYEAERVTEYRLSGRFIPRDVFETLSAPQIKVGSPPVALGFERRVFRVDLPAEATAVVVLSGDDRALSLQDEAGTEHRIYRTPGGRLFAALGAPLNPSAPVLKGESKPRRFFVRVGPGKGPTSFGKGRATLAVLSTADVSDSPYLVPFSSTAVENEPVVVRKGSFGRLNLERTGNAQIGKPVIYKLELETDIASGFLDSSADLNMVLCDEFGRILNDGDKQLELRERPLRASQFRQTPNQETPIRVLGPQQRYLVIFVNPFVPTAKGGSFRLTIRAGPTGK